MPNLVGIGLSQVPTNSMLGGMAYQDPEHASIKDLDLKNLSQINSEIADTATNIFVYDTRKDSDGGAWRKRTQNTSWYNETLGTATRGTRREFPAVAVIVCGGSGGNEHVHIYDGDDPDLPMWMKFTADPALLYTTPNAVSALNGTIIVATPTYGVPRYDFIGDTIGRWRANTTYDGYKAPNKTIAGRDTATGTTIDGPPFNAGLINDTANDVAMTVLPNAPIDSTTGLPVPTIAVATDGGANVIMDDGTIIATTSAAEKIKTIEFTEDHGINAHIDASNNANKALVHIDDINKIKGLAYNTYANWDGVLWQSRYASNVLTFLTPNAQSASYPLSDFVSMSGRTAAIGSNFSDGGLTILEKEKKGGDMGKGMVAFVSTSYNTGYMHGDIKGAFLSDTDTTNVTGSELITNGTFDSNTTGWTARNGATLSHTTPSAAGIDSPATDGRATPSSAGIIKMVSNGGGSGAYQSFTTVVGEKYVASFLAYQVGYSSNYVKIGTTDNGSQNYDFYDEWDQSVANNWASGSATFIATATTTYITLIPSQVSGRVLYMDQISVRLAEEDRSVNNNGLAVYGTITKSAVATGAELVAYSGWNISGGNYMEQPFNSDLDFGTGNYYISVWLRQTYNQSSHSQNYVFHRVARSGGSTSGARFELRVPTNLGNFRFYQNDGSNTSYSDSSGNSFPSAIWTHVVCGRSSGDLPIYINGEYDTVSLSGNSNVQNSMTNTSAKLFMGGEHQDNNNPWGGDIALFRIGSGFPSPEQIKKMYEDEKCLFHENAKATLHGSSNAVTALAFDDTTNLLHVGTSAGRSEFQGLRRINNTTTAVTTAISVSNELVAEQ